MKIPLSDWVARNFSPPPNRKTVSKWRKEGRICPVPIFIGRGYFVEETARFICEEKSAPPRPDLALRNRKPGVKSKLVERINVPPSSP